MLKLILKRNLLKHKSEDNISFKFNIRVNSQIKAKNLRVIGSDGSQKGVCSLEEALRIANEENLDLVEISPASDPPVARIVDFGKFKYEKERAYKDNKKKQKMVTVKEIKIKPQIDVGDLNIKRDKIEQFLSKGNKVKVILVVRGRRNSNLDRGKAIMEKIAEDFSEKAIVEQSTTGAITLTLTAKKAR
jgi:translation initiation factor IF-3